jgi:hypothetical protein
MEVLSRPRAERHALNLLVGIELGVAGGAVMLLWFALISPLMGHPWWFIPNLLASYFYYAGDVRFGPGMVTVVGSAVHLCAAGLVGAANGVITPGGRLFGLGIALVWYLACYLFLWKRFAPMMLVHASQPVLMAGYFLYGSTLGWHQHLVARMRWS